MNKAKFQPIRFRDISKNKYLPLLQEGFPLPNEVLKFMDCLVSVSYLTNVRNGKVNHNESEIGFKILLSVLPGRNVEYFQGSWLSIKNLSFYCLGYSEKSIRKGAEWLVKKGLFNKRSAANNKAEFQVNYTAATYEEIASDIARQIENDVKKEDIVFKGVRYLTTTEYKKDGDNKATGNFTRIPFFLPYARAREVEGQVIFDYVRNPIFDSLDGNTLRVILQLSYKMHYNIGKKNSPDTEIKIDTLMKLCGLSRNKISKALDFLVSEKYLRAYKVKRNSRAYIFNFRSYRMAKVKRQLSMRRKKRIQRPIIVEASFTVSELYKETSFTIPESPVLPSQDDYNKNLILIKIQESINKDIVGGEDFELGIEKEKPKEVSNHDRIKKELLSDFRNLKIDYHTFQVLNLHLDEKLKQKDDLASKNELIQSYQETKSIGTRNREIVGITKEENVNR